MTSKHKFKNRLIIYVLSALLIVMTSFTLINVLSSYFSLGEAVIEKWDGTTASSFSAGNGTKENPYVINNGNELSYFKSLLNGNQYNIYSDKYYVLGNDIDLNNKDFETIKNPFKGNFSGNGHSIFNINNVVGYRDNDFIYFGIFSILDGAVVENINFNNVFIKPSNDSLNYKIGVIAGEVMGKSEITNISIINSRIDLSNVNSNQNNIIGGVFGIVNKDVNINNIYTNENINLLNGNSYGRIAHTMYGNSNYVITNNSDNNSNSNYVINKGKSNNELIYQKPDYIDNNNSVVKSDTLVNNLNTNLTDKFYWKKIGDDLVLEIKPVINEQIPTIRNFAFSVKTPLPLHNSGISGDTLYINDLDSDYNYYMGNNYFKPTSNILPNGNKQDLYDDNNLAKVYIQYNGMDIADSTLVGNISLDEQISKINYYKYYKVENKRINIELIDNPFADRPNNKVFNGWVTDTTGVEIKYDKDIHVYYASIPITDISNPISITFYARWVKGNVANVKNNNNSWDNAFSKFDPAGFKIIGKKIVYEDVSNYYIKDSVGFLGSYPNGSVNSSGQNVSGDRCWSSVCEYYIHDGSVYNPGNVYYKFYNGTMNVYEVGTNIVDDPNGEHLVDGYATGSYYKLVKKNKNDDLSGYYDIHGNYISNDVCHENKCDVFEYIPYVDNSGVINVANTSDVYAKLINRDSNIAVLNGTVTYEFSSSKPFTITGLNNGKNNNATYDIRNFAISANADLRIEHIKLRTSNRNSNSNISGMTGLNSYIYGNYHNLKIGRGITYNNGYVSADGILGGSNNDSGNANNITRYRLIVESGSYNNISLASGVVDGFFASNPELYLSGEGIYGSDIDRIKNDNNSLQVYHIAAGTWGGNVYSYNENSMALHTNVKSGSFGTGKYDYTTGIYVGGLNGGNHKAMRGILVEGGSIYNLIGGPLSDSKRESINDILIEVKGGSVDYIFGGAGRSETYGNRIIGITGGTINYSVFGGSNGYSGNNSNNSRGTLFGDTLVYVGGNAKVGNSNTINSNSSAYGEEIGSVFGIGNGNSQYASIGTARNSNVIIDGNAEIFRNVYGGGNFGAVGVNNNSGTSTNTTIKILGGNVHGSVYGGGNNNGSGNDNVLSNIKIDVYDGVINNVYGGSRTKGTVYGNVKVSILGGTINADVYGGGEGGYTDTNSPGTYVKQNVDVVVGDASSTKPLNINGNVYGGSAYGTVNGVTNTATSSSFNTTVIVNNGIIAHSVFGGGKGSANFTPNVNGNVTVTINGGSIGKVFGGNDAAGSPMGKDVVYLNGGSIGDVFGGGNSTGQTITNVFLQGSTVVNLFGGSNLKGVVDTTNVLMTSGTVTNIYGGNNAGTSTKNTNVTVNGGTINGDIYGGGMKAPVTVLSKLSVSDVSCNNVFGGSQNANAKETNVLINNVKGKKVFGGSNTDGLVNLSTVVINANDSTSTNLVGVFGGNNAGGTTEKSNITINNGTITDVYGGGDIATTGNSKILVNNGIITSLYGGGNEAGLTVSDVSVLGGTITNVYGGSNKAGTVGNTSIVVGKEAKQPVFASSIINKITGNNTTTTVDYSVTIKNISQQSYNDWELKIVSPIKIQNVNSSTYNVNFIDGVARVSNTNLNGSKVMLNANSSITFNFSVIYNDKYVTGNDSKYNLTIDLIKPVLGVLNSSIKVSNIYGGNNLGGTTGPTKIVVNSGSIHDIYGGGNKALSTNTNVTVRNSNVVNIFGGGKAATVTGNTYLDIDNCNLNTNVFGGGDEGEVNGNTEVFLTNSNVNGSVYAGGNGVTATVYGNTNITIDGNSVVGTINSKTPYEGCVFGGGNRAFTGTEKSGNSTANVNIVGAHIYGNVYGGANTSIVYGGTITKIGNEVVLNDKLRQDTISIDGNVFGGGEANAAGSEHYDFDFNSVVGSINIYIDGSNYLNRGYDFNLSGSIFGSGNASSSSGISNILIKKLGTRDMPSKNLSIQRTNNLIIDNSFMELEGVQDSTNDFASIKYSFNRIDKLTIKNNSTLLLRKNANLLKEVYSGVDVNNSLVPAVVTINKDTKTVTKNVDNRIYMLPYNNLNITTTQDATSYGKVTGMTFFGMYNASSDGSLSYGLYDYNKNYGDLSGAQDMIIGSSYVLGLHHNNHDITQDGFYTNVFNEEMTEIITEYIEPSPPSANFYRWMIGMQTINYIVDLTASKYSSLGTFNLTMLDFPSGNVEFEVIGFNSSGLNKGINLIDSKDIPRISSNTEDANKNFGLTMKSETLEWTSYGETKYLGTNGGSFTGDTKYVTDSQNVAPSLMFYLNHSKNITKVGDLGSVLITLQSKEKINEIESKFNYVTITVNIVAKNFNDGNFYDASISYDKKYEMPSATSVNITNRSQFTAYYSLYAPGQLKDIYGTNYSNYHVLSSTFAFPVGTQITMIDYGYDINNPQYYYYDVTDANYQNSLNQLQATGEAVYRLSDFIKMGSTSANNTYDDVKANKKYYGANSTAMEDFIFIFDLKETNLTGQKLGNSILMEVRNENNNSEVITVLGIRRQLMQFNLYDSSNVVLNQEMNNASNYLYYNIDNLFDFKSKIGYDQTNNGAAIIDTNYESRAMGLNMYVYDNSGNQISSSLLVGTVLSIDGNSVFADSDGVFRTKLAGKVSNLKRKVNLRIDKALPPGQYVLRFVLFASPDGKHNSSIDKSSIVSISVSVIGDNNAIKVTTDEKTKVIDGKTGLNKLDSNINKYDLTYQSVLANPNLRICLYKRDVTDKDTLVYNEISFNTLFKDILADSKYPSDFLYEKAIGLNINGNNTYEFQLQDNLVSGTYKLVFRLYDGTQLIEEENEHIIVVKDVVK